MRIIKLLGAILVGALILLSSLVYFSTYHPDEVQEELVYSPSNLPTLAKGQSLKVLSWNVQFMAGNENNHFFYDDGSDPWPDLNTVERVTQAVAKVIEEQDPDIVLLQEVDDIADRTHKRDQNAVLRALLPQYPAYTETFYWKAAYVPHPSINGRVGMKLVILSKYALNDATRYALPMITTDDILRRQFNLKRAIQQVSMPVEGAEDLIILNTHLSAFAKGSDTMERQIETVLERIEQIGNKRWIMGGDFNLLPNEAAIASFKESRSNYNEKGTELAPLIALYPSVPALADIEENPEPWYTYMSPRDPERSPDRTIDYIFYSPLLEAKEKQVLRGNAKPLSDHLPVMLTVEL